MSPDEPIVETPPAIVESTPLPVETPPIQPAKPRIALPGTCPDCGKNGFENDAALRKHVLYQHTLPKARSEARAKKAGAKPETEAIPLAAADFSDITGKPPAPAANPIAVETDKRFEGMATMTFDMSTNLMARIFGPEWLPNPDADNPQVSHEKMAMVEGIKKYYESANLPDIPPGYMLCFLCLAYSAPRMAAQPTKTKLQGAWLWLKSKFQRRRYVAPTIVPNIVKA